MAIVGAGLHRPVDRLLPAPWPTRPCGSWCSRPRSRGSAPPAATAAGARHCSRPRWPVGRRPRRRRPRRRARPARRDAGDGRRGRPRRRGRGHRRPLRQGRHDQRWPAPRPSSGRARAEVADARAWGRGEDDLRLLDAAEADGVLRRHPRAGGDVHPGLRGHPPGPAGPRPGRAPSSGAASAIHERTRCTAIEPGRGGHRPRHGPRRRRGARHRGLHRLSSPGSVAAVAPVLLADHRHRAAAGRRVGASIGLRRRETFTDHRHLIIYGQRTADDRLVFGGRGAPYHFGSRAPGRASTATIRVFRRLRPDAGGPLPGGRRAPRSPTPGAARSACRATGAPRSGSTAAPGWPGPAATSATASAPPTWPAAPCADLVLGRDTDLIRLPWVGHRSRAWEPEPLRWLGINAGLRAATVADAEERLTRHAQPDRPRHGPPHRPLTLRRGVSSCRPRCQFLRFEV